jgi:hypothetical protein
LMFGDQTIDIEGFHGALVTYHECLHLHHHVEVLLHHYHAFGTLQLP